MLEGVVGVGFAPSTHRAPHHASHHQPAFACCPKPCPCVCVTNLPLRACVFQLPSGPFISPECCKQLLCVSPGLPACSVRCRCWWAVTSWASCPTTCVRACVRACDVPSQCVRACLGVVYRANAQECVRAPAAYDGEGPGTLGKHGAWGAWAWLGVLAMRRRCARGRLH